jgi:autotransporter-associated beta strand protein
MKIQTPTRFPSCPRKTVQSRLLALAAATILFAPTAPASFAPLPFYEPFPSTYTEGGQLGASPTSPPWDFGNSPTSSSGRTTAAAALGYPQLTTDTASSKGLASHPAGSGSKDRGASLSIPPNTTLYASFLFNVQSTNLVTTRFFGLSTSTNGTSVNANGATVFMDTKNRLLIAKNSGTPAAATTYSLTTNNTYLVVLRYKFNTPATNDDSVDLWLDPTSLGNNASIPAPTLSTTANADVTNNFGSVAYFQNIAVANNGIGLYYIDEIRVSTNWADVTPTNCSPGALYSVTGGGTACAGSGFPVGVSGSDVGVDYQLYTNGVYTANTVSGTGGAISFGIQATTGIYTVLASNTTSTCVAWMSGSATVANLAPPSIVTQPNAITVATGGAGTFSVVAAGDALTYQWRRDGTNISDAGHYSGTTTAALTVYPVNAGDVAAAPNGYDVVVSGTCTPPVTSSRVALSSKTAANLIWVGDGSLNKWDVATSANWSSGSPATFDFGDNVTFDDTATNTAVVLASPFLSPSTIEVNAAQNFGFVPGGNISGPNTTLTKDGTGTLFITNANTFAGGTVISNGVLSINTGAALGGGTITFGGGLLEVQNVQVTLTNPIVTTGDGTISTRNTSTSALTLANTLNGASGSLTISNGTTAAPTVTLNNTNITFNRPLVLQVGGGTRLLVDTANPSGNQTFSGVISGGGTIERRGPGGIGGNTILSGQNTYSGGTLLNGGAIGVASDSVVTTPPTVDSGPLGTGTLTIDTNSPAVRSLFAVGGARTIANPVVYNGPDDGSPLIISGTNDLTLAGSIDLITATRTIQVDNTGRTIVAGDISDGGLIKTGNGALYLNGNNTYTDPTLVSSGTLGGTGALSSPVTVASGATLAPGASVGTLTINSDLTLGGNLAIEVNKSLAQSNDIVQVSGVLTNSGTGTVVVSNLGAALVAGDNFQVFSQPLMNGGAMTVTGGGTGVNWTNRLAFDGSIAVLSITTLPTTPTNITQSVSGGNIVLSWPASYTGWELQSQTNGLSAGLRTNWVLVTGSTTTNQLFVPIANTNGAVFFRMHRP